MAETHSAFFYGTLLHPKVLKRVIGNDGEHLKICPAILLDYTRHRIKNCDYPGIVPYETSRELFGRELNVDERSVRGNLVTGLSSEDIKYLDGFEGDEYIRKTVPVHPLQPLAPLNTPSRDVIADKTQPITSPEALQEPMQADTYVWDEAIHRLEQKLWTFEDFMRDSAWKWVGPEAAKNEDYAEVDRRRAMNGVIERAAERSVNEDVLNQM